MVPLAKRDYEPRKRSRQKRKIMKFRDIICQVPETHVSGDAQWTGGYESEAQGRE